MHSLYFVKVRKEEAENSEKARRYANRVLEANNFASDAVGYFGSSKADWYVVGGRWSGELQQLHKGIDFMDEAKKAIKTKHPEFGFSMDEIEKHADELQALWEKLGFAGKNIFARDTYAHEGYEDDAMILTKEIVQGLKDKKYSMTEAYDDDAFTEEPATNIFTDEDVGKCWIVVIDYHI